MDPNGISPGSSWTAGGSIVPTATGTGTIAPIGVPTGVRPIGATTAIVGDRARRSAALTPKAEPEAGVRHAVPDAAPLEAYRCCVNPSLQTSLLGAMTSPPRSATFG